MTFEQQCIERARQAKAALYGTPRPAVVMPEVKEVKKVEKTNDNVERLAAVISEQQKTICELRAQISSQNAAPSGRGTGISIAKTVAREHGLSWREFTSDRRDRHIVHARQLAMYLMHTHTVLSLPQIGKILGDRDHTTVLHGIRAHKKRHLISDNVVEIPRPPKPRPSTPTQQDKDLEQAVETAP